jgi:glycosyltransferase involved in cell wall biosynthesis
MKILFIIDTLVSGGKERRLTQLMKSLRSEQDIEFELVVMSNDIHYKEVFDLGINIHQIIRKTKKDFSVFNKVFRLCKTWKPDIIHCWDTMTAIYIIPACKLLNIKMVNGMVVDTLVTQTIHNKLWLRARLTFPFSDIIVGNSVAGLKSYRAPDKKSVCIYNGMDLKRFEQLKDPSLMCREIFGYDTTGIFVVGMVAAFEIRKDYKTLIKTAITLTSYEEKIRFILVGDGVDFQEIKDSVPESLRKKIIFLGKRSDVESIINIFDLGVLLTNAKVHGEGISNSIIEYMALGKPVIATSGGGTNEVVLDNQNGYLIDAGDTEQLTEKIAFLMKNREKITKLGDKGRNMVKEYFDIKIMTRHYVTLYKKLVSL